MLQDQFHHGFPPRAWKAAKAEAKTILKKVARRKGVIAYSDLAAMISNVQMRLMIAASSTFSERYRPKKMRKGGGFLPS